MPINFNGNREANNIENKEKKTSEPKITREIIETAYQHIEVKHKGGYFPLGANSTWHGGVHLHPNKPENIPVAACASGHVIAARLEYVKNPDKGPFWGSRNFILVEHVVDMATLEQLQCLKVPSLYTMTTDRIAFFDKTDSAPP